MERLLREHLVGSGRGAATSGAAASGAHTAARGNGAQTSEARPLFSVNVAVFLWAVTTKTASCNCPKRAKFTNKLNGNLRLPENKLKTVHEDTHQTRHAS